MNSTRKYIAVVSLIISGLLSSSLGEIVVNDATITNIFGEKVFTLTKSIPSGGGLFAIFITDKGSGVYELSYAGIAEEYALFTATSGEMFTPSYVQTNTPFVSNNGNDPGSGVLTFDLDESKYLAYWDDRTFDPHESGHRIPNASDNYGWAILYWDGIELSVTESATALGGGIIVGTTLIVPAPAKLHLEIDSGLSVLGTVGAEYSIQYTPSLFTTQWECLTNIVFTSSPCIFMDFDATNVPTRFYRAVGKVNGTDE